MLLVDLVSPTDLAEMMSQPDGNPDECMDLVQPYLEVFSQHGFKWFRTKDEIAWAMTMLQLIQIAIKDKKMEPTQSMVM